MRHRLLRSIGVAAVIALVAVTMARVNGRAQTQDAVPAPQTATAAKTPWGEPNLQGLWAVDLYVPLERPAGKARGGSIPAVFDRQVTPPDGMDRRPEM